MFRQAVNLFPAGTNQRWEVCAEFINQHSKTAHIKRQPKETLAKAKELQSGNFAMSSLKVRLPASLICHYVFF